MHLVFPSDLYSSTGDIMLRGLASVDTLAFSLRTINVVMAEESLRATHVANSQIKYKQAVARQTSCCCAAYLCLFPSLELHKVLNN